MDSSTVMTDLYPDLQSRSAKLFERAKKSLPGGNSRLTVYYAPYPIYLDSGQGAHVRDVDGNERLDFVNNMTALMHGHSHPAVVDAVRQAAGSLMGVGAPTLLEVELAEMIVSRLKSVEQVRFCNSGTEAVMMAVRAARGYTGRPVIARMEGLYHGASESMDSSQVANVEKWGPAWRPTSVPNSVGTPYSCVSDVLTLPFNDLESTLALLKEFKEKLAGVVMDPYPSRLGFNEVDYKYLLSIRDFCTRNNVVLIYDEVMSFRVGYQGAQGRIGVYPDITALGKVIGGGLPCGAIGGSAKFMSAFDQLKGPPKVPHGGTNNANPLVMAAGIATLKLMTPDLFQHVESLGERFRIGVAAALRDSGVPGFVSGVGSLNYLFIGENIPPKNFRDWTNSRRDLAASTLLHHHLLNNGILSNEATGFIISSPMTEEDIDFAVEQIEVGLKRIRQRPTEH